MNRYPVLRRFRANCMPFFMRRAKIVLSKYPEDPAWRRPQILLLARNPVEAA